MSGQPQRGRPNVLITGTPGTGKTTTSEMVAQELGFQHINVGEWVREKNLHSGWNAEFDCFDIDEDKASAVVDGACMQAAESRSRRAALYRRDKPLHTETCAANATLGFSLRGLGVSAVPRRGQGRPRPGPERNLV